MNNVTIIAEAFFNGEPKEAIETLKNADARIIFALCYVSNCPRMVCEAYKQGLYGPNVVWIFNTDSDLTSENLIRPQGCTKEMTDEFAKSAMYVGVDLEGAIHDFQFRDQMGTTAAEITQHIKQEAPDESKKGFFSWRSLCYEVAQHSAFVIARVEDQLQKQGETLSDIVGNSVRAGELEQMFRESVLKLEINSIWGPSRQSSNSSPSLYRHATPDFVIEQTQPNLTKTLVFFMNEHNMLEQVKGKSPVWRTFDGNPPRSKLFIETIHLFVPETVVIVIQVLATAILIPLCLTVFMLFKWRNSEGLEDSYRRMTFGTFLGSSLPLFALFTFPHQNASMVPFCQAAPGLVGFGLMLVTLSLSMKIFIKFFFHNGIGSLKRYPKLKVNFTIISLMLLTTTLVLVVVNETSTNRIQPETVIQQEQQQTSSNVPIANVKILDKLTKYEYEICSSQNFILGWILLGLISAIAIFGILASVIVRKRTTGLHISDGELSSSILYFLSTFTTVLVISLVSIPGEMVQLIVLAIFAFVQSLVVVGSFWWWKLGKHFDQQPSSNQHFPHKLGDRMTIKRDIQHVTCKMPSPTAIGNNQNIWQNQQRARCSTMPIPKPLAKPKRIN